MRTLRAMASALVATATGIAGAAVITLASAPPAAALDNGLALTPQMGFNNWNATHCGSDFNEAMVKGIADLFVSSGLKNAGYQYVNLDDCWALPNRDASGNLVPDPVRFPERHQGRRRLRPLQGPQARHLLQRRHQDLQHQRLPRRPRPRAAGREPVGVVGRGLPEVRQLQQPGCRRAEAVHRDAGRAEGHGPQHPVLDLRVGAEQALAVGQGRRQLLAHAPATSVTATRACSASCTRTWSLAQYAGPGHWNDPDMLEVGNGGMTDTEYQLALQPVVGDGGAAADRQ